MPIENYVQAFELYIALNSHVRKPVIHISLNPSPKDILSKEQMTVLAQEFMEKFGYGNQPYIVWLHKEIDCNLGSCASSTSVDCRKEPFIKKG